jgi:Helix-turn-helix
MRRRLEDRGWKVGSASEFLGLTPQEEQLVELRLVLCKAVRERRKTKHIPQEKLAERMNTSQSRIAKLESCDPHVSTDMMFNALFALGASLNDTSKLIAAAARK